MAWQTVQDRYNLTGRIPDGVEVLPLPRGGTMALCRCPCGRRMSADMLYKVEERWICDACINKRRVKSNKSRGEFVTGMGGPRSDSPRAERAYHGGRDGQGGTKP